MRLLPRRLPAAPPVGGFLAGAMLAAVGVHLAGVAVASWLHRENLVRAMLTGRKDDPRATP